MGKRKLSHKRHGLPISTPEHVRLLKDGPLLVHLHSPRFNPRSRQLQPSFYHLPHPFPCSHFPVPNTRNPGFWNPDSGPVGLVEPSRPASLPSLRSVLPSPRTTRTASPRFTSAKSPPRRSSPLGSGPGDARPRQPSSQDPPSLPPPHLPSSRLPGPRPSSGRPHPLGAQPRARSCPQ